MTKRRLRLLMVAYTVATLSERASAAIESRLDARFPLAPTHHLPFLVPPPCDVTQAGCKHNSQSASTRKAPPVCGISPSPQRPRCRSRDSSYWSALPESVALCNNMQCKGQRQQALDMFKEAGISNMVYKTDQSSPIRVMVDEALRTTGKSGIFGSYEAVPEYSAIGESASNGRAERTVQSIEDQLRALKLALESVGCL